MILLYYDYGLVLMLLLFQKDIECLHTIFFFFFVFFPSSYFDQWSFLGGLKKGTIGEKEKKRYRSSICDGWSLFIRDE